MTEQLAEATTLAAPAPAPEAAKNEGAPAPDDATQASPVETGEATQDAGDQTPEQGTTPDASEEAGLKEGNTDGQAETLELTAPEGFEAFADDFAAFNKDMGEWFKANPKASTADVLKEAASRQASLAKEMEAKAVADRNAVIEKWTADTKAHERIGGDKLDAVLANVQTVRDKAGADEVFQSLERTGLGSHPVILEALSLLGEKMSDSKVLGTARGGVVDTLSARYPKTSG